MVEDDVELSKVIAGEKACELLTSISELKVIGIGTGSTVKKFIETCLHFLKKHKAVASSPDTVIFAKKHGIHVLDPLTVEELDAYVDGADEVSSKLDMVKGRGGALLREKTLAYMSRNRIYIVDYTKYTGKEYLYAKPIPVEIAPMTLNYVLRAIERMGLFEPIIRTGGGKDGPVITDNGNYIIDLKPLKPLLNPRVVHYDLKSLHGVIETGLFPSEELVDTVIVGYPGKATIFHRK